MLHVLDWCGACTGLVSVYWTGFLHVLDVLMCVACTVLVCCMYWTGV